MSYAGEVILDHPMDSVPLLDGEYFGVAPEFVAVLYRPGDYLGLFCAALSLVPPMILVAHLTVFLCRRQARDLWFAAGQVFCEGSNQIFKHLIAQPRPLCPVRNMPADSFGMPSAHSQFMGYIAAYTLLQLARDSHIPTPEKALRAFATLIAAGLVGFSRYYLYYHSTAQVLGGLGVGAVLAVVWLLAGELAKRVGLWQWGLELWPCRLLCVRDSHYNVRQEYAEWLAERERKQR